MWSSMRARSRSPSPASARRSAASACSRDCVRAEPMKTMVSSTRRRSNRAFGSRYSARMRSARASLLFRKAWLRYALGARRVRSAMAGILSRRMVEGSNAREEPASPAPRPTRPRGTLRPHLGPPRLDRRDAQRTNHRLEVSPRAPPDRGGALPGIRGEPQSGPRGAPGAGHERLRDEAREPRLRGEAARPARHRGALRRAQGAGAARRRAPRERRATARARGAAPGVGQDRKSTRLNSSHLGISYAVFCLKKKNHLYKLSNVPKSLGFEPLRPPTRDRQNPTNNSDNTNDTNLRNTPRVTKRPFQIQARQI